MSRKTLVAAGVAATFLLGSTGALTAQAGTSDRPAGQAGQAGRAEARGGEPDAGFRDLSPNTRAEKLKEARNDAPDAAEELDLGRHERLVAKDVLVDEDGTRHLRYDRTLHGLEVVGGDLVVHRKANGELIRADRAYKGELTVPTAEAELSKSRAARIAREAAQHVTEPKASAGDVELVVFAAGHAPVLSYRVTVTGKGEHGAGGREAVFVNAADGEVVTQYELRHSASGTGTGGHVGTVSLDTTPISGGYTLVDPERGNTKVYDSYNSPQQNPGQYARSFTGADNDWGSGRESAAVDAHYGLAETWDYYESAFGRQGIRNDGRGVTAYVHVGNDMLNAFYQDQTFSISFGDGNSTNGGTPLTELDVAAHEMTHGVTAATAGLVYQGESGGLNEATSDIFAAMVEFSANNSSDPGDYYVGEKLNMPAGYFRRMDNPAADGKSLSCWNSNAGSVDVHYSSGIGNHWFYLASEGTGTKTIGGRQHTGSPCNGDSFDGIGRDKAAAVYYRALTTYMTSTTDYAGARTATLRAAADLYGADSQERYLVSKSWAAVDVGTALPDPGDGGGDPGDPTDPPGEPGTLSNGGFEEGTAGWTQSANIITSSAQAQPHSGSWYAWMMGYGRSATESLNRTLEVPASGSPQLTYWTRVVTEESYPYVYDTLSVKIDGATVARHSNADASSGYVQHSVDLSAYAGQTVTLEFAGREDAYLATYFFLDDVALS